MSEELDRLALEWANGRPVASVLWSAYCLGHKDGHDEAVRDERD